MKHWIALALSVLFASAVVAAQEPGLNDKEKAYLAQSMKQRAQRIVELEGKIMKQRQVISDLSRATVTTYEGKNVFTGRPNAKPGRFATSAEKDKAIADAKDELLPLALEKTKWENARNHYVPPLAGSKVGEMGLVGGPDKAVKVVRVLDEAQVIVDINGKLVLLAGFNTANLAPSKPASLSTVVEIVGTYDYKASGATKAGPIPKAQPFDDARVQAYEETHPKEIQALIDQAIAVAKGRPQPKTP